MKRFCLRHRGVVTGELNRLLICGTGEKTSRAVEILGDSLGVKPEILCVPNLTNLYELDQENRQSHSVPAVASVLPLLIGVSESDVPDMFAEVRRAGSAVGIQNDPDLLAGCRRTTDSLHFLRIGLKSTPCRRRHGRWSGGDSIPDRSHQCQIFGAVSKSRVAGYLKQFKRQTIEPDWDLMLGRITQSLPDQSRLNEYRVESDGHILLDGTVLDESIVYELVSSLRELPGVTEVALKGTTPEDSRCTGPGS